VTTLSIFVYFGNSGLMFFQLDWVETKIPFWKPTPKRRKVFVTFSRQSGRAHHLALVAEGQARMALPKNETLAPKRRFFNEHTIELAQL
jgi:hypothetical protein